MATLQYFATFSNFKNDEGPSPNLPDWFDQDATVSVAGTSTEITFLNSPDPTLESPVTTTKWIGTGLTYDGFGKPNGGTVSTIELYEGATLIGRISGLAVAAATLATAAFTATVLPFENSRKAFELLMTGADSQSSGAFSSSENFFGGIGADTLSGGDGSDFIRPGAGADSINGGNGNDWLAYDETLAGAPAKTGVNINLANATVTDAWGFTDSITGIERVRGTEFADTLIGTSANNRFRGQAGADSMDGGTGVDRVEYNSDSLYGGNGNITINLITQRATDGFGSIDTIVGFEEVVAGQANDTIIGDGVNNSLTGLKGNDSIDGGNGDDFIRPGAGNNSLVGGLGFDFLSYDLFFDPVELTKTGINISLAAGTGTNAWGGTDTFSGFDALRGTQFADTLTGDINNNHLQGIHGGDSLVGGVGVDLATYQADADFFGGGGAINANFQTNRVTDGFGSIDSLSGIEGVTATNGADTFQGGNATLANDETYNFYGRGGNDSITSGTIQVYAEPGAGNDTFIGGASIFDQISYQESTQSGGASFNLATGVVLDPYGGTDSISSVEWVRGTNLADTIIGNGSDNVFRGIGGSDSMDGAGGFDQVRYDRDAGTAVYVDLAAGFAQDGSGAYDTILNFEGARGAGLADRAAGLNDVLLGNGLANRFEGQLGNDLILGRGGADTLFGQEGNDSVWGEDFDAAGVGNDQLFGSDGDDFLFGGKGNDSLDGGNGVDWLIGVAFDEAADSGGSDFYNGGAGADVMLVGGPLSIGNFNGGADNDIIYGGDAATGDTITGGSGSDFMWGKGGTDTYLLFAGDVVANDFDIVLYFKPGDQLVIDNSFQGQAFATDQTYSNISGAQVSLAVGNAFYSVFLQYTTAAQALTQITYFDFP